MLPPDIQALITAIINHYEQRIAKLEAELTALKKTPRNSSVPPSTEHPHAKPPRDKKGSKKKRGGQPGHPKHDRKLIPTEECSKVVALYPDACRRCAAELQGDDPEPLRHQVWELPPIKPDVTEYQRHRRKCECCGETTCASLPEGVPSGQSGPRLVAFVGLLMGHFRQSKRRAAFFLQDFLGMPCCPALTVKMQNQVAAALEQPYEELKQALAGEQQLNMDETPTKQGNQKAWLWTAVAAKIAVFAIFSSRKGTALPKLLGDSFTGVINCDRAKMYWQAKRLQWCWAHLKRDFQALIDHQDRQVRRLGHDLMRQVRLMFDTWWRYKLGKTTWDEFQRELTPVRREVEDLLLRGVFSGNARLVGMCSELYNHREWLWTFADVQGIEPTNNAAERALRPAVIYRKLSFGTQSASGSRFIERMLTVSETCRLQSRSIFAYLTAAVEASFQRRSAPSLLPAA
ncbi:MAG TPA: IS66 family transposase [Pirellulales bacterium]|nr:IS66 family transposase [Pirellulales bacterium]